MRRTMISFGVAALALGGCGGGDDPATDAPPTATTGANAPGGTDRSTGTPDDGAASTTAPSGVTGSIDANEPAVSDRRFDVAATRAAPRSVAMWCSG